MLCLTRAPGERIRLERDGLVVWVVFNGLNGLGEARLLIDAPPDVAIDREEILPPSEQTGRCTLATYRTEELAARAARAGEGDGPPAYCPTCTAYHLHPRRRRRPA